MSQADEYKQVKIAKLLNAEEIFSALEQKARGTDRTDLPQDHHQQLILVAAYAVGRLDYLGEERLLALEREGHVNSSTVSGSSLLAARSCINKYMGGERMFTRDDYEQLERSCRSVRTLVEMDIIKWTL